PASGTSSTRRVSSSSTTGGCNREDQHVERIGRWNNKRRGISRDCRARLKRRPGERRRTSTRSGNQAMFDEEPARPQFSVVIPLQNEEESIKDLCDRLCAVMTGRYEPAEFIFVDDHSSDSTARILAALADDDPRVLAIRLKRNYGQTVALAAGFDYA